MSVLKEVCRILCEQTKFYLGTFGKTFTRQWHLGEVKKKKVIQEKRKRFQVKGEVQEGQDGCDNVEEWHKVSWKGRQVPNQGEPCCQGFGL